jgi:hypothetical protein
MVAARSERSGALRLIAAELVAQRAHAVDPEVFPENVRDDVLRGRATYREHERAERAATDPASRELDHGVAMLTETRHASRGETAICVTTPK